MILATLANMNRYEEAATLGRIVAYSPETGEVSSARVMDYQFMAPTDCLEDSDGHPMVLARRIPEHYKPLEAAS